MKVKSGVLTGFLSVVAAIIVTVGMCCLFTDVAEAGCQFMGCSNCVLTAGSCGPNSGGATCQTDQEKCNSCKCIKETPGGVPECICE